MMAKAWHCLRKVAEECGELIVELMKLNTFPTGEHPGRRRSVILSTEDELADVLAAVNYFIDRNKLDRARIEKRAAAKRLKFIGWWGEPKVAKAIAPKRDASRIKDKK